MYGKRYYLLRRDKVRDLLYSSRLTQGDLATELGLSMTTVHNIINRKNLSPSFKTLKKLGAFCGVDADELIDFVSPEEYDAAKREAGTGKAETTGRFVVHVIAADPSPERLAEGLETTLNGGDARGWRLVHVGEEKGSRLFGIRNRKVPTPLYSTHEPTYSTHEPTS